MSKVACLISQVQSYPAETDCLMPHSLFFNFRTETRFVMENGEMIDMDLYELYSREGSNFIYLSF